LFGSIRQDRERRGARVYRNGHADAGIRTRKLLQHQNVGEEVRTRAAVLFWHTRAHQAQRCELAEQLARKVMVAIPLGGMGIDLGSRKLARERLDLSLVLREAEVHVAGDDTWRLRAPPGLQVRASQAAASSRRISRSVGSTVTKASTTSGSNCRLRCSRISVCEALQLMARR